MDDDESKFDRTVRQDLGHAGTLGFDLVLPLIGFFAAGWAWLAFVYDGESTVLFLLTLPAAIVGAYLARWLVAYVMR